jgi:hypothetical protein
VGILFNVNEENSASNGEACVGTGLCPVQAERSSAAF